MSKIILEFDSVEEAEDARTALDGYKWKTAMWEMDQWLRAYTKVSTHKAFEECREKLHEIINDNNLILD